MKKLIMVLTVCIVLGGVLATNGTFAFLNNVNVTEIFSDLLELLGADNGTPQNDESLFKVELVLQTRDSSGELTTTSEVPMLIPAVYADNYGWKTHEAHIDGETYYLWTTEDGINGIVDKFVSVVNKSEVDMSAESPIYREAYFRIAFAVQQEAYDFLHLNFNEVDYTWSDWKQISINGRSYQMIVATYTKPLAVNETSPAALMQVALDKKTTSADAEKISSDFLQIQVMAIDATPFKETDCTVEQALDAALPLNSLNPF